MEVLKIDKNKKTEIIKIVDKKKELLKNIALKIHRNPELAFQEKKAVKILTKPLKEAGFNVQVGLAGMDTAFKAVWENNNNKNKPKIAFLAEYDALKEMGHACGHNLIGTIAVGAALALTEVCNELPGTLIVLGTPAEEGGGGKVIMANQSVFDEIDAVMLCHPKNKTMTIRDGLALVHVKFKFYGKESHASVAPEKGISALEAMINSFVAINSLRQFVKDNVKIHGIINKGGVAPNIVPKYCEAEFLIRASTLEELEKVKLKVYEAVKHAGGAVGADVEIEEGLEYADRNNNKKLANLFKNNLEKLGEEVSPPPKIGEIGSSDIGNVSHLTATIHPYIKICSEDIINHTPEFKEAAASEKGIDGMIKATKAMAMTGYDLFYKDDALKEVRSEFNTWEATEKRRK